MNIGIIGSGGVAQTLAKDLVALGYKVQIGTRSPEKLAEFVAANPNIQIGSLSETATFGETIMLATNWAGTQNALELAGAENFAGKVVWDITNPLDFSSGKPELAVGFHTSAGELVQGWLPEAKVVKALNIITASAMLKPNTIGDNPDMFIAGNDPSAKLEVSKLLEGVGWGIVDLGDITKSRLIEPLAMIWITHGFNSGWKVTNHAFKLLNK